MAELAFFTRLAIMSSKRYRSWRSNAALRGL
eukprot:CAMPEP_0204308320 /NCGR_PEP_ID=MMETSP0469-20131031/441_1 /ASSEMBLY_ACC=CAM_ASM_000384 /TAXON_ID=2969 /ORGANISM="Oxyrrhis marina" /LENGTH=30 /DNA_ID= /DNA_START= /DNA_END= /DNA_ORIENTATION=